MTFAYDLANEFINKFNELHCKTVQAQADTQYYPIPVIYMKESSNENNGAILGLLFKLAYVSSL